MATIGCSDIILDSNEYFRIDSSLDNVFAKLPIVVIVSKNPTQPLSFGRGVYYLPDWVILYGYYVAILISFSLGWSPFLASVDGNVDVDFTSTIHVVV